MDLPLELHAVKEAVLRTLGPIKPTDSNTQAERDFLFKAKQSPSSSLLPRYYLVYFIFVELLGYRNLGRFEKIAWSIPIDYNGKAFLVEDRKFGLGIFVQDLEKDEEAAKDIAIRIGKAVKAARPFFDWVAKQAAVTSSLNVANNGAVLYDRYEFLRDTHYAKLCEAELRKKEIASIGKEVPRTKVYSMAFPAMRLRSEALALALSAVEAFFSWIEHVFIHIAILSGKLTKGTEVANLANSEWSVKFKEALDLDDPVIKKTFDLLMAMRKELRNYVAHGAFGKQGEAFSFHSGAGAVPMLLPHRRDPSSFRLASGLKFDTTYALSTIDDFVKFLWSGQRASARIYIQDTDLPLILTFAADGTYADAMKSTTAMTQLIEKLIGQEEQAVNMDW